jgi:Ino eighty subunit 1
MRAQLRTYHAIPALQAHQDPNSYKQLQDAPRLKSILKGASEDRPEPNSLEKIKEASVPRTNPVNLIFVICQFAPKITDLHFPKPREFSDLIMRQTLSSKSRARAFLWLMWHYLESDFTQEGAEENPFGAGVDYGMDLANQGIPRFEYLSEKQAAEEDVDPQEEVDFGMVKQKERKRIIEADQAAFQAEYGSAPKRGPKPKLTLPAEDGASPVSILAGRTRPSKYESDIDSTRSTPPPKGGARAMGMHSVLASHNPKLRGSASLRHQILDNSSPAPGSSLNIIVNNFDGATRRSRPLTAHQLAVEQHRNQRVNYILGRGIRRKHHQSKKLRKTEGVLFRAMKRLNEMTDPFEDSEGEESLRKPPGRFRERGFGGLMPLADTEDDFGEELAAYAAAFRRTARRLERWDGNMGVVSSSGGRDAEARPHVTNGGQNGGADDTEDEKPADADVDGGGDDDEDLDDMDKQLLGLASENEDQDEEELDDVEKEILGLRGDETEEEGSDGMEVDG